MASGGLSEYFARIPEIPRHIMDKLMTFNVLQLCALVSEKPGPKWSGASDHHLAIQEIARRWEIPALARRIENMTGEEPIKTYARIMQIIPGGNPALKEHVERHEARMEAITDRFKKKEPDAVAVGLAKCLTLDDLKRVSKEQGLEPVDWVKVDGLVNFGLKRMYIGNKWRTVLRKHGKTT